MHSNQSSIPSLVAGPGIQCRRQASGRPRVQVDQPAAVPGSPPGGPHQPGGIPQGAAPRSHGQGSPAEPAEHQQRRVPGIPEPVLHPPACGVQDLLPGAHFFGLFFFCTGASTPVEGGLPSSGLGSGSRTWHLSCRVFLLQPVCSFTGPKACKSSQSRLHVRNPTHLQKSKRPDFEAAQNANTGVSGCPSDSGGAESCCGDAW